MRSTVASSHAAQVLRSGDMILAVNSQPVTSFIDVESLIAAAGATADQQQQQQEASMLDPADKQRPAKRHKGSGQHDEQQPLVNLTVFRAGAVIDIAVCLGQEDSLGTDRLVHWCGAQLQTPHRAVRELGFQPEGTAGVFISRWHHGSPAHRYGLFALHWILEVNGQPTPDLDTFLQVVAPLRDGDFARVKVCHLETTQHKVGACMDCLLLSCCQLMLQDWSCTHSFSCHAECAVCEWWRFAALHAGNEAFSAQPLLWQLTARCSSRRHTCIPEGIPEPYHLDCCAVQVLTLKLDNKYWPSWELRRDPHTCTWARHLINSSNGTSSGQPGAVIMAAGGGAAAAAGTAAAGAAGAHAGQVMNAEAAAAVGNAAGSAGAATDGSV